MMLKGGDSATQLVEAVSHGELGINLDEISLWSQKPEMFWLQRHSNNFHKMHFSGFQVSSQI